MPLDAPEITARELRARLGRGDTLVLLDVRQPWEYAMGHLEGALLIPLGELTGRVDELDPAAEIVAYCKVGERSAYAVDFLRRAGFARACHLRGGVVAWVRED